MDSAAMLEQFSMMSNVQAIDGLKTTMEGFITSQDSKATFGAAGLIGKNVSYVSGEYMESDGIIKGSIEPPPGVAEVKITLKDKSGQIVKEIMLDTSSNEVGFDFEFNGEEAGDYLVEASFYEGDVQQHADVVQNSSVSSVRMEEGTMFFKLASGKFALLEDFRTISG